jgi:hypothetical protein
MFIFSSLQFKFFRLKTESFFQFPFFTFTKSTCKCNFFYTIAAAGVDCVMAW